MKIYLVQHGKAASKEEDPERSLTAEGREETEKTACFLAALGEPVAEAWHSGKTRSRQTAETFAAILNPRPTALQKESLAPGDSPDDIAYLLRNTTQPVLIAGHLPFLSRLAGKLLTANADGGCIAFRNSGIVCLERFEEENLWHLLWAVVPDIL